MSVNFKEKGLKEILKDLDPKEQDKVTMRALNKTLGNVKAETRRTVRAKYNIKAKDLKLRTSKATKSSLIAIIAGSYRPLSLLRFGARQVKKGVSVAIMKGRRLLLRNMFIAKPKGRDWRRYGQSKMISSANDIVFKREITGRIQRRKLFAKKRVKDYQNYPVKAAKGPSIGAMMKNKDVKDRMDEVADERFKKNLDHEIQYLLSKKH